MYDWIPNFPLCKGYLQENGGSEAINVDIEGHVILGSKVVILVLKLGPEQGT